MLVTQEEAEVELRPIQTALNDAIRRALAYFVETFKDERWYQTPRTEASLIHDLMVRFIRETLESVPGIVFRSRNGAFVIDYLGRYLIKPKKLDKRFRTRNIPTQSVMDFIRQQPELPGMPEIPTNLHIGYRKSHIAIADSSVWVTCPNDSRLEWRYECEAKDVSSGGVVVPMERRTELRIRLERNKTKMEASEDEK